MTSVHATPFGIADESHKGKRRVADSAPWARTYITVFLYEIAWLFLLGALGWAYSRYALLRAALSLSSLIVGSIWFGALGGTVIALKSVYEHRDDWNEKWIIWHFGRPISGAVVGGLVYMVLLAVNANGEKTQSLYWPIVFTMAFVFATQEARFFNFIYQVAKLVVNVPGADTGQDFAITDVQPQYGPPGTLVLVHGTGFDNAAEVVVGGATLNHLTRTADGTSIAGTIPASLVAKGAVDVIVTKPNGVARVLSGRFKIT